MNIQINTGHNIQSNETLIAKFRSIIESSLRRVSDRISKVEVHLKDEDGNKEGKNDKRCMIEARLEGMQPIAVTNHADSDELAVTGAVDKLKSSIDKIKGRLKNY
jgi:ribosome-associated translation inhibitor RaiA